MRLTPLLPMVAALLACTEQFSQSNLRPEEARKPTFAVDDIRVHVADGVTDDLATAGLGLAGLRGAAPSYQDAEAPTPAELRRRAYYENYRALLALNDADGFGRLYADAIDTPVAGREYLMPVRYNDHSVANLLMVQVPDSFDTKQPCLVVTASSGSRGIYGAVGVVGSWALHKGCAVATTDKGTGTGFHFLDSGQAQAVDGTLVADNHASVHFKAAATTTRADFQQSYPHRVATKHAHSGKQLEMDWGHFALQAAQFGFYVLNQFHSAEPQEKQFYTRTNTTVIGAGISNGGGALLRAAEEDDQGWLDAVVVSEPNVFLPNQMAFSVNGQKQKILSLPQLATHTALLGPCAALAEGLPSPLAAYQLPLFQHHFATRCGQLKADGYLTAETTEQQAAEALQQLTALGLTNAAQPMVTTSAAISLWEAYVVNYLNSYLGARVEDHQCGVSYASVDAQGTPVATAAAVKAGLFGNGSGVVPTGGITLINDQAEGGPKSLYFSRNAAGQPDLGYQALRCFHTLAHSEAVSTVVNTLAMSGDLRGKPALIIQGTGDNLIQVNHLGRAYATLHQRAAAKPSLRYVEISHGQHFDALLNYAPMRMHYVPMHFYYEQALNQMLAHLTDGKALPPSQTVQANPVQDPSLPLASLPAIALNADTMNASSANRPLVVTRAGVQLK
ncbi:3-hydroxybutyrate oligomer hydrolase family protein [Simiduia aestuariiviva]|uniref:Hydroxybutyrate-dimer hydrolase n=1 Tax=Simiduia aestuariiviva TaxID=1510459 RepID=A0A839UQC6_9GAMM|nr:3-hydroxybutyrate oligomer hydrolase family protein [Simiduia aestuariiviva]MBB3168679.1 hydroxybutyrate-dimer hydrolase [Simiduia aestuariiviva]